MEVRPGKRLYFTVCLITAGNEDVPWEQLDPGPQGHDLVVIPGKALTESTSQPS